MRFGAKILFEDVSTAFLDQDGDVMEFKTFV